MLLIDYCFISLCNLCLISILVIQKYHVGHLISVVLTSQHRELSKHLEEVAKLKLNFLTMCKMKMKSAYYPEHHIPSMKKWQQTTLD